MKTFFAVLAAGATLVGGSAALANPAPAERPLGVEASIPFADTTGVRNFRPDGDRALWIEGSSRQWYRAELFGPCIGLDHALRIGFVTHGTGVLDKFGKVVVDGSRCQITSLVTSAPPPAKKKAKS